MSACSNKQYVFTNLDSLKSNETYNVICVVKFANPVRCSKGSGYLQTIGVIDPSMVTGEDKFDCKKLICNIFSDTRAKLNVQTFDVLIMHRLKVNKYKDSLQGQGIPSFGFSFGAYFSEEGGGIRPRQNQNLINVTSRDLQKVKELLSWSASLDTTLFDVNSTSVSSNKQSENTLSQNFIPISDMRVGKYFDLRVQIVRIIRVPGWSSCVILRVWDGTTYSGSHPVNRCPHPDEALCLTAEEAPECCRNLSLEMQASDYSVDVFVYDEHCETVKRLAAGMFVDLINIHFMTTKQGSFDVTLHGGSNYGRCIKVFTANPTLTTKLSKTGLLPLTELTDPSFSDLPVSRLSSLTSEDIVNNNVPGTSRSPVVTGIYRVDCIVRAFHPDLTQAGVDIDSLLNLLCPKCNAHRPIDSSQNPSLQDKPRFCKCDSVYSLLPSLAMILEDTEGWLVAHLVGSEMCQFIGDSYIENWLRMLIDSGNLTTSHFNNIIKTNIMLLLNRRLDVCVQKKNDIFYIVKTKMKNTYP